MENRIKYVYVIKDKDTQKVTYVGETFDVKRRGYQLKHEGILTNNSVMEVVGEFQKRKDALSLEAELKHKYGIPHHEALRAAHWNKPKPIVVYKKDTNELVGEYYCVQDAVRRLDLIKCDVYHVLAGRCKQHKGYTFQYKG